MAAQQKKKPASTKGDNPVRNNGKAWKKNPKVPRKRTTPPTPERLALLEQREEDRIRRREARRQRAFDAEQDRLRQRAEANKKTTAHEAISKLTITAPSRVVGDTLHVYAELSPLE